MRTLAGKGLLGSSLVVILGLAAGLSKDPPREGRNVHRKTLTKAEERVIVHKGTETPFSGEYWDFHEDGVYHCRRCGAELFDATSKFDSGCGWPSFDFSLPGAVKELPDADGMRTEIVCAACGAHLGHVFLGEGFTQKNTRHCVNSISLEFTAREATVDVQGEEPVKEAYFAGGCFWGVEFYMEQAPGVVDVTSGYMGGTVADPTYEQVCGGRTGHLEAVRVRYDPGTTNFETLAKLFFEIHDPTQADGQGPDIGMQYLSAVFTSNPEELAAAGGLVRRLEAKGLKVATEIRPMETFYPAESYHQDYYRKTGKHPYCHGRVPRFDE